MAFILLKCMALNSLTKLEVTKGDTLEARVAFTSGGAAINLTDGEVVCKVYSCGTVLTTKTITSFTAPNTGIQTIIFTGSDTSDWPIGLINYEIKLTTAAGSIKTKSGTIEVGKDV